MTGTIWISGGSGGIGKATAMLAARAGWNVAFTWATNEPAAQTLAASIEAEGRKALAIRCDVTDEAQVLDAFDATLERFGGLDAVVVNAGVVAPASPLAEMDIARMRRIFDTNILGAFLCAREAARRLPTCARPGRGSIVLISSTAARLGSPAEYVDYAASKGAIDTLNAGLSKELAPKGIRVNSVRPGLIDTDIHARGGQPDRAHRLGAAMPMGRAGTAEEVAQAILWLCGPEASYVTGAVLDVAGGR